MYIKKLIFYLFYVFLTINFTYSSEILKGEERISLDGDWFFKTDQYQLGIEEKWFENSSKYHNWDKLTVPGSWELINEYSNYVGKAWYVRDFDLPTQKNKVIFLKLEGISMSYKVFVNGKEIGNVLSGNHSKSFNISNHLKSNNNTIAILVDNSLKWGAYFNWGGIRSHVLLSITEPIDIIQQKIIAQPNLVNGTASVKISFTLRNFSNVDETVFYNPQISYQNKIIKSSKIIKINLPSGSEKTEQVIISLEKDIVKLWDFDHPHLYYSTINLIKNNEVYFALQDRFGIRKVEFDGFIFKINGLPARLAGYNWIADDRVTGNTLPAYRYKEDIDLMKAAGANMARISHRPLPPEVMDYLDEKGILVVAEFNNYSKYLYPDNSESKEFATDLINENFNHPSIIGWSVGNEMASYKEHPEVKGYVSSIINFVKKELDSTRFVLYVSNTADFQKDDPAQYCDFIMINKYGNFINAIDSLHKFYPKKPIFLSEYGEYENTLIYDTPNNSIFKNLIVDKLTDRPYLFGFAIWSFNDYRSVYRSNLKASNTPLDENRRWGIVDVYRNRKRAYQQMRKFYSPIKNLEVKVSISKNYINNTKIIITPRAKLDIPSFILKDYILISESQDLTGKTLNIDFKQLTNINPGQTELIINNSFKKSIEVYRHKVSLLSPTGYVVADTIIYFKPPVAPKIKEIITAEGIKARIIFDKPIYPLEYQADYGIDELTKTSYQTIDHYIDIENLKPNQTYQFSLTSKNGFGKSVYSDVIKVDTKLDYKGLPPVIWLSHASDKSFFVGTSADIFDMYYEIKIGKDSSLITPEKELIIKNYGMFRIPDLKNGVNYFYKIRRVTQQQTRESQWSETKSVIPQSKSVAAPAKINGYLKKGDDLIISCEPAKNANGYQLNYQLNGKIISRNINQSVFEYLHIKNVGKGNVSNINLIAY